MNAAPVAIPARKTEDDENTNEGSKRDAHPWTSNGTNRITGNVATETTPM
jgi:hypothetical protein